jgi:hypothetical protein
MAMAKVENPPAFPTTKPLDTWDDPNQGMSLRDYFAGQAMTELRPPKYYIGAEETRLSFRDYAKTAYDIADAMLAERAKTEGQS